ncbi:uncharacterized protein LOC117149917, partial [Drosophila mauritiana]|uniref:Uncharacterized protein LOC117149917 n=1 Tax=Drosophila mauritiana TaxID=7226 RepID=A0A6P8LAX6_DROMA
MSNADMDGRTDGEAPDILNPTSEVGSVPHPAFSEDQWRAVVEMQNRNFAELVKIMQVTPARSKLIIALSNCMEGTASQWLTQISYQGMTWQEFQELSLLFCSALK